MSVVVARWPLLGPPEASPLLPSPEHPDAAAALASLPLAAHLAVVAALAAGAHARVELSGRGRVPFHLGLFYAPAALAGALAGAGLVWREAAAATVPGARARLRLRWTAGDAWTWLPHWLWQAA